MRLALVVALAGCDGVFGLTQLPPATDGTPLPDAPFDGLVAHYPMDALGSTLASCMPDATGRGHDGACVGGTMPGVVGGIVDQAFDFAGNVQIHVPHATELDTTSGFTVAAWVRVSQAPPLGGFECPFNRLLGQACANSWQVCLDSADVYFEVGSMGNFVPPGLAVDAWHQVAIEWDGTMYFAWIDGILVGSGPSTVMFDANDIVVGTDIDGGVVSGPYTGLLDDLRIYNRALTQSELAALPGR